MREVYRDINLCTEMSNLVFWLCEMYDVDIISVLRCPVQHFASGANHVSVDISLCSDVQSDVRLYEMFVDIIISVLKNPIWCFGCVRCMYTL